MRTSLSSAGVQPWGTVLCRRAGSQHGSDAGLHVCETNRQTSGVLFTLTQHLIKTAKLSGRVSPRMMWRLCCCFAEGVTGHLFFWCRFKQVADGSLHLCFYYFFFFFFNHILWWAKFLFSAFASSTVTVEEALRWIRLITSRQCRSHGSRVSRELPAGSAPRPPTRHRVAI